MSGGSMTFEEGLIKLLAAIGVGAMVVIVGAIAFSILTRPHGGDKEK